jgi:hypothetical protein
LTAIAPGWSGQSPISPTADDWEPAIAFDPHGTYAYLLTTRYGAPKACGNCPAHQIWLMRSTDNGTTWGPATYLCPCSGARAQNDPEIEVAADGSVYAVWMNDYNPGVVFARSTDHGLTWTTPVAVKTKSQKFTDTGATWTQATVAVTPEQPVCTAGGCPVDYYGTIPALAADANGRLVLTYTGPTVAKGPQRGYALRSADKGLTWSTPVDVAGPNGANANFTAVAGRGSGDFRTL